jgi:hypothetical protein
MLVAGESGSRVDVAALLGAVIAATLTLSGTPYRAIRKRVRARLASSVDKDAT